MTLAVDDEPGRVRAAVLEAGRIAMHHFRQPHESWEKGPGQLVTEADLEVDRFLKQGSASTRMTRLAVRGGRGRSCAADRRAVWIVDPIDGTRSFADGVADSRLRRPARRGRAGAGLRLNPATDEMFEAARGHGAMRNGAPYRPAGCQARRGPHRGGPVRKPPPRVQGADPDRGPELSGLARLQARPGRRRAVRRLPLLAPHHDWDIAAAALLLAESGAVITDAGGGPSVSTGPSRPIRACSPPLPRSIRACWGRRRAPMRLTAPTGGHAACRTEA